MRVGERLPLPDLANTLAVLANDPRAFYEGPLASRVSQAVLSEHGWIEPEDLRIHRSEWTEPVSSSFHNWVIEEFPPNSQGWLALLTLRLAECIEGPSTPRGWTHRLVQAAQIVYALRDSVLADRAFMKRPPEWYLEPAQLAALADLAPVRSEGLTRTGWYVSEGVPQPNGPRHGDTVAFEVIDGNGLAVSCIQSIYSDFGTGLVVPGTGIVLQNRGCSFSLNAAHPNSLAPLKRPRHTLSPALATLNGRTVAAFGSMGGEAQTQIHCQLLTSIVQYGLDPATAIAAPRWFTRPSESVGDESASEYVVLVERRHPHRQSLVALGHAVVPVEPFAEIMGHGQVILRDPDSGVLCGSADPRSDGLALGF
jgi:gamma-glutamyltranspeptidase/glutathione hydrolase